MRVTIRNILAVLALCVLLRAQDGARAEEPSQEYKVKAAFIQKLIQFVDWPGNAFEGDQSPIVICVLGENRFGDALEEAVRGKVINGRSVSVTYRARGEEMPRCQVLFVSSSENGRLEEIFRAVDGKPVLTIGEGEEFPAAGGTIRFYLEEKKLRFEINPRSAEKARLTISSKLMSLARIYKGK